MGLRFRRSVILCKGVKLNFGKTGMSVSLGGKGYHKTFHQNGNVTTSVGIPGTGIYWTDTKRPNKNTQKSERNLAYEADNQRNADVTSYARSEQQNTNTSGEWIEHSVISNQNSVVEEKEYCMDEALDAYFSSENVVMPSSNNMSMQKDVESAKFSSEEIYRIYKSVDTDVDWTEILVSASEDEVYLERNVWKFYKSIASKILKGDIDAYLDVIEYAKPLDDLLDFGGEFEFGTDSSGMMEIEFRIKSEDIIESKEGDNVFCDYVCATVIRVARDILALLPVGIVIVHAMRDNQTVLSVLFNRAEMNKVNFMNQPQKIINRFKHNLKCAEGIMNPVDRVDL